MSQPLPARAQVARILQQPVPGQEKPMTVQTTTVRTEGDMPLLPTMFQSYEHILAEQLACRQAIKLLEDRVVTSTDLENIIQSRIMTKQDFADQRQKDDVIFKQVMKERVTRRWLMAMFGGMGCFFLCVVAIASVITGTSVVLLMRFWGA